MNWRCFFGFHPWRLWERPFIVEVRSPFFESAGEWTYQRRECLRCGKVQQRRVD